MRRRFITRLAVLAAIAGSLAVFGPASPASASIGLYRASAVGVSNAVSPKSITVGCNNVNDRIISVGGRINDGFGDVLMTRAFVNPGLTVATVWGIEAIPTGVPWSVEAFVVCAPPGAIAGLVLVENTAGPNVNDKFPQAACPAGKKVFGGGYYLDNANGLVAIDEFTFDPNLLFARATAYNYGAPGNYSFTVQAICGTPAPSMSRITFLSANNALSPKTVTTNNCPFNTQVSAVGTIVTGALGHASIDMLNPRPQLAAGESTVREIGAYGSNWTSQVEALCVG
ncbi:hypothetical protein F4553_002054 [Allocatelliglobosispora scoriae]|uniref:Uncharacterized protein n=1 Tax=Allocatelliglobosispora scoriae TaxID=643052 RepID=A0A841BLZ5_9ACTN|nr:hypothetical protein [Allocatelliglobosispora scoriae]MBB5868675.1 hypothetical protein [Allocatelliglobosispora scoriae]